MNEPDTSLDLAAICGLPPELFAGEVFRRYASGLLRVAEDRLAAELCSKVCPEDIVQSAFKSFFRRLHEFQFTGDSPDVIWGLLVVITIRKCRKWEDVFFAEKRDVHRERAIPQPSSHVSSQDELVARDPSPSETLVVTELVERLMDELAPRQREMLLLRIQGHEVAEIATACLSSRRTVARTIAEAKSILLKLLAESG